MFDEEMPLEVLVLRIIEGIDSASEIITGITTGLDQHDTVASKSEIAGNNAAARTTANDNIVICRAAI